MVDNSSLTIRINTIATKKGKNEQADDDKNNSRQEGVSRSKCKTS